MVRKIVINGETLVEVRGGAHMSGTSIGILTQLGLAEGQVTITPQINFRDVYVPDFGPNVPADVLWMLSSVRISMTLIFYDPTVLDICIAESMGGSTPNPSGNLFIDGRGGAGLAGPGLNPVYYGGTLMGAGVPLGGLKQIFDSGWHYISTTLTSPELGLPWCFPKTYLNQSPVEIPIGNDCSKVRLEFTAIPYQDPYQPTHASGGIGPVVDVTIPYPVLSGPDGWRTVGRLKKEIGSSGSILWTRFREVEDSEVPIR